MAAARGRVPSIADLREAARSSGAHLFIGTTAATVTEQQRPSRWGPPTREPWRSIYRVAKAVCVDVPRAELRLVSSVLTGTARLVRP